MSKYIISDLHIMSGMPVIRGTRIPLSRIVYLLGQGHTIDSIYVYPHVNRKIFRVAIDELINKIDSKQYEAPSV